MKVSNKQMAGKFKVKEVERVGDRASRERVLHS